MTGHVLVAPDKFKGSLTAAQVAAHLAAGLRDAGLDAVELPVADGGEGTLDAAVAAGFTRVPVTVTGPTGAPVRGGFAMGAGPDAGGRARKQVSWPSFPRTAVIELAAASGLALLPRGPEPLRAGSRGAGELIRAALDAGATRIVLGVGGSAGTDGGAGLLAALGARLLDAAGAEIPDGGGGLAWLARVDLSGLDPRLARTDVVLASDVDNPLLGPSGAAAVYGPQKGAGPDAVALLDAGLARWARLLDPAAAGRPGAGAAGGVGFAALAALGARRRAGVDVVLDLVGFAHHLDGDALVVTGEGAIDEQTLHGKAPAGVAAAARAGGVPVVAVAGRCDLGPERLARAGIHAVFPLSRREPDPVRCMAGAARLLREIGRDDLPARVPRLSLSSAGAAGAGRASSARPAPSASGRRPTPGGR